MGVGPTLGTGVFLAGGQALAVGGPGSLLVSYISLSLLVYFMATSVGEVATYGPRRHGAMIMHGYRYMKNNSLAFATASLRWYTMAMFVPYEIITSMVTIGQWSPGKPVGMWLILVTLSTVGSNLVPERIFRSSEKLLHRVKIGTMTSLVALSLSICLGGRTGYDRWGFQYWKNPGAMHEYLARGSVGKFLGLLQSLHLSTAAFSFVPEMIVHRAELAETMDETEITEQIQPAENSNIPRKVVTDVFQTTAPYVLSSLCMGVMAPYNDPLLTNNGTGAGMSPFVIGMYRARIKILPVTATLAIFLSSVSSSHTFLYLASRSLHAMAQADQAPSMFKIQNSWGVPWVSVLFTSTFTSLTLLSMATSSSIMTTYFILFVSSSGYLSWMLSCVIYRRYRQHLRAHKVTTAYRHSIQPLGSIVSFIVSTILLLSNGLNSAVPGNKTGPRGARIAMSYLSIPLFFFLYLIHQFGEAIPRSLDSEANSVREMPLGPTTKCPPPARLPHGRSLQPPTAVDLDQVWVMAREARET
ncbi:Amino acid/polyamine transporter I [Penicillium angulare]|uniref:Amino acid/polyamine transporter I n=1 Tax=Penicillium angulare TaxID=116970 RepID=A0A9W9JZI1_9EURO|nr:Amino acid/polyamine transporter I [Penicillium angulare]